MSALHTPGPWRAEFGGRTMSSEIWSHGGVIIADVHSHVAGTAEFADAVLIAMAPELLEQLKAARTHITLLNDTLKDLCSLGATVALCGVEYDAAKTDTVIAKATGGKL